MKTILAIAFLATAATCMAQNRNVNIRILGIKERVPMTPGKSDQGLGTSNPGWVQEDTRQYYIVAIGGSVGEEWAAYEFSFIPEDDGKVTLQLMGPFMDPETTQGTPPIWVAYDNLAVTGADVENPDFENGDGQGSLDGWNSKPENLVMNSGGAQSGKNYVRVSHDKNVRQDIQVKKGQEVTIKFQVKAAEAPK